MCLHLSKPFELFFVSFHWAAIFVLEFGGGNAQREVLCKRCVCRKLGEDLDGVGANLCF